MMEATDLAGFLKVTEDATRTVGSANEIEQAGPFPGAITYRFVQPCVEPRASHPKNPAHQCVGMVTTVLVHEAILHSGSLAKYRAAS